MWIGAPAKYHSEARTLCGVSWRRRHAKRAAEPRRGVRSEVDVRLCGSGSPQSTTAKRGHFVGYHGEGEDVLRCKPPNLAAIDDTR